MKLKQLLSMLFLTHRTDICPVPEMKIGGTYVKNISTGERVLSNDLHRSTLHWSFADTRANMGFAKGDTILPDTYANVFSRKGPKYIMMEPIDAIQDLVVGGWLDDLYMVGPHVPSEKAILIAPSDEIDELIQKGFAGNFLPYDPALTSSEIVFQAFVSDRIDNFKLKVEFPITSDLNRIRAQFGDQVAELLINIPEILDSSVASIDTNFYTQTNTWPIRFEKTASGYAFITDKSAMELCAVLAIRSTLTSELSLPGQTALYFSESQFTVGLEQLFPNALWLTISHGKSPFGRLENAILDNKGNRQEVMRTNLIEIASKLTQGSRVDERFAIYQRALTNMYRVHFTDTNLIDHSFFLSRDTNSDGAVPVEPSEGASLNCKVNGSSSFT